MSAVAEVVVWQDVEFGAYVADLPLWHELAGTAPRQILDVGAGVGRVALELARAGHAVTALERDPELLRALRGRAAGLPVTTIGADARDFDLGQRFALCIVPMQTIQLLGGLPGRRAFLRCAHDHLEPGGTLAVALADPLDGFDDAVQDELPLPDVRDRDGWLYSSQPIAVRVANGVAAIERRREIVAPDGTRQTASDIVRLDRVSAAQLAREAGALGFDALAPRAIPATDDHVGSEVAMLRA